MKGFQDIIRLIIINLFNPSGVWIWNWFIVILNWKLLSGNFNITIINGMMIKSTHYSWNHRVGLEGDVLDSKWSFGGWLFHYLGGLFVSSPWSALNWFVFLLRLGGRNFVPRTTTIRSSDLRMVVVGRDINVIYRYLEKIGSPTKLTTSGQRYHHLSPSYSINNDVATLQPVIVALRMRQKSIYECFERIGQKSDACIIRGPKFLPPSLRRKTNQFSALHGDETNKPPR